MLWVTREWLLDIRIYTLFKYSIYHRMFSPHKNQKLRLSVDELSYNRFFLCQMDR